MAQGLLITLRIWLQWVLAIFLGSLALACLYFAVFYFAELKKIQVTLLIIIAALFVLQPIYFIYLNRKNLKKGRFKYFFIADPEVIRKQKESTIKQGLGVQGEVTREHEQIWNAKKSAETASALQGLGIIVLIAFASAPLYMWWENIYAGYKDNVSGSDATIYPISCSNLTDSFSNCQHPTAEGRIAYKIDAANRSVVAWYPDEAEAEGAPIQYQNYYDCGIVDKDNWSCKEQYGESSFGMNSGKYFDTSLGGWMIYASAAQWDSIKYPNSSSSTNN